MTAYILAMVTASGSFTIGHFHNLAECEVQRVAQSDRGEFLKCLVYIPESQ